MNFPADVSGPILGIGLVIASQLAAWLVGLVRGGFRVGRLEKTMELRINGDEFPTPLDTAHWRLEELEFRPGENVGQFIKSGVVAGALTSFTHAKTKKAFTLNVHDDQSSEARTKDTLLCLDPILANTGEYTYRDAVMGYVSGQTDSIAAVANTSFAAFSRLIGGITAWVAVIYLKGADYHPLWMPFRIITIPTSSPDS